MYYAFTIINSFYKGKFREYGWMQKARPRIGNREIRKKTEIKEWGKK